MTKQTSTERPTSILGIVRGDLTSLLRQEPLAWLCIPLILICSLLPFINIGAQPFWADEAIAILPAHSIHSTLWPLSPFDLDYMPWQLQDGLWDPATPLYRYTVAAFTSLTGFSESTARSFSVLAGLLGVLPFYALVRKLQGRQTALLAATFLVTSPTFMLFSREARHFTFLTLLVLWTLYHLYSATEGDEGRSRGLWVIGVVATLLCQTLGYGILPIVGLYVILNDPRRFLGWRHLPMYLVGAAAYLAVVGYFWRTLPFFHDVTCSTRPECQPIPWYYLAVLFAFVSPMTAPLEESPNLGLSVLPILFLMGLASTIRRARAGRQAREQTSLLLLWFFVPLIALSVREVKFDRYLYIWVMPLCALFLALGVQRALRFRMFRGREHLATVGLVLLVVLAPQLVVSADWEPGPKRTTMRSAWVTFVSDHLFAASDENWERIRWQTDYLQQRMRPGDVVVSSLDDGSLQYYLGQFVYGFLNSRRTDEFFVDLLDRAETAGTKVWFVDTLPQWNFCLGGEPEPWRIDCRVKYERFYTRCAGPPEGLSPACQRLALQ